MSDADGGDRRRHSLREDSRALGFCQGGGDTVSRGRGGLCGSLDEFELFLLIQEEIHSAGEALGVDDPDPRLLEPQAHRLDLLVEATNDPDDQDDLREMARICVTLPNTWLR
jgi:hypothetical protein